MILTLAQRTRAWPRYCLSLQNKASVRLTLKTRDLPFPKRVDCTLFSTDHLSSLCRKRTSGNLIQYQLSDFRGNGFCVSLRLKTSLGEAGPDAERPSPIRRVQQDFQLPNGISLGCGGLGPPCLWGPAWSIHSVLHHLSYTGFPGLKVWCRIINFTQICRCVEEFLV